MKHMNNIFSVFECRLLYFLEINIVEFSLKRFQPVNGNGKYIAILVKNHIVNKRREAPQIHL